MQPEALPGAVRSAIARCPFLHSVAASHGEGYAAQVACCPTKTANPHAPGLTVEQAAGFEASVLSMHGPGGAVPLKRFCEAPAATSCPVQHAAAPPSCPASVMSLPAPQGPKPAAPHPFKGVPVASMGLSAFGFLVRQPSSRPSSCAYSWRSRGLTARDQWPAPRACHPSFARQQSWVASAGRRAAVPARPVAGAPPAFRVGLRRLSLLLLLLPDNNRAPRPLCPCSQTQGSSSEAASAATGTSSRSTSRQAAARGRGSAAGQAAAAVGTRARSRPPRMPRPPLVLRA